MDRKTTNSIITTAIVGIAIAAGTLAFTSDSSSLTGRDSFSPFASSASDHDSFRFESREGVSGSTRAPGSGHGESVEFTARGHEDRTVNDLTLGHAPSADRDGDAREPGDRDGRDLVSRIVLPDVRRHESECTSISVVDLSARDAADCGIDAADWSLVTLSNTYRQAVRQTDAVKDWASDQVSGALRSARQVVSDTVSNVQQTGQDLTEWASETVSESHQDVKDIASEVASKVKAHTDCATDLAGEVMDASVNDVLDCA